MAHTSLESHPQRDKIIDALLEGQSYRQVAGWTKPPVSHSTIMRYALKHVSPAISNAAKLRMVNNLRSSAEISAAPIDKPGSTIIEKRDTAAIQQISDDTKALIRVDPIMQRVQQRYDDLDHWHQRAIEEDDARSAASLIGAERGMLELHGRLEGRFTEKIEISGELDIVARLNKARERVSTMRAEISATVEPVAAPDRSIEAPDAESEEPD